MYNKCIYNFIVENLYIMILFLHFLTYRTCLRAIEANAPLLYQTAVPTLAKLKYTQKLNPITKLYFKITENVVCIQH